MTDDTTNKLLQFGLHNSNLPRVANEPDNIENENLRNANKLSISNKPNEKDAGTKLIKMMADDGNESAKNSIEHLEDLAIKISEINSINAKSDRKSKPSKKELNQFKNDWEFKHGAKYGWRKNAKNKYGISYPTIKIILDEV